jgi:hypothetical protein
LDLIPRVAEQWQAEGGTPSKVPRFAPGGIDAACDTLRAGYEAAPENEVFFQLGLDEESAWEIASRRGRRHALEAPDPMTACARAWLEGAQAGILAMARRRP